MIADHHDRERYFEPCSYMYSTCSNTHVSHVSVIWWLKFDTPFMLLVCMQKLLFINYKTTVGFVFKCINRDGCSLFNILIFLAHCCEKVMCNFHHLVCNFHNVRIAYCTLLIRTLTCNFHTTDTLYGYTMDLDFSDAITKSIV